MTEIYDNIRTMREKHNLTQAEMADKLHMSTSGYSKIEQGTTKLFHEKLEDIADIFGVSIYQLMPKNGDISVFFKNENSDNNSGGNTLYCGENSQVIALLEQNLKYQQQLLSQKDNEINALKDDITSLKKVIELLENR